MHLVIELTDMEKEICSIVGKARYYNNRKHNIKINIIEGNDFSYKSDIEAVMAEFAFCKQHGIFPDEVFRIGVTSKRNGNDMGDAYVDNMWIDVKSTKSENGMLFSMVKNPNVDLYSLMIGTEGTYRLAGYITNKELCQESRWGHHQVFKRPCYAAKQEELKTYKEIRGHVRI